MFSQIECGRDGQITQPPSNSFCGSINVVDYIPQSNSKIKTIDIVVNVMQKEYPAAPLNFINTTAHKNAIKSFLFNNASEFANYHPFRSFQHNAYDGIEYPNDPYIQDSRIQFRIIESILFQTIKVGTMIMMNADLIILINIVIKKM